MCMLQQIGLECMKQNQTQLEQLTVDVLYSGTKPIYAVHSSSEPLASCGNGSV